MKCLFLSILILSAVAFSTQAQDFYGSSDVRVFREGRDKAFCDPKQTPLRAEDFAACSGLNYFGEDKKFVVAAKFERSADEKYFLMPTSSGVPKKYIKYGVLKFNLDGADYTLSAYQSETIILSQSSPYKNLLFIPFKDLTNGKETYGGGRYLNIVLPNGNEAILNFNLSYNPSCAYGSDKFSCPLPPKENFLQAEIKAGEKTYLTGKR
jgi:uncharacterized protein